MSNFAPNSSYLPGLTAIVITLNEAPNIVDCLNSLHFADQIVVVDGGSTDNTVALAASMGAQVHVLPDWQGFGMQKNRALDLAKHEWVLAIDADERVGDDLAKEIELLVKSGEPRVGALPRLTFFCGQWIKYCGWTPDYVDRLWPQGLGRFSNDLVHERLVTNSLQRVRFSHPLLHYSYPTPSRYWEKLSRYSQIWAEQRLNNHAPKVSMTRAVLSGIVAFIRTYLFRLGFLDGALGFAVCAMQSQAAFGKYFTLYCLQRNETALITDKKP